MRVPQVLIVAGEASSDAHGAGLVRALRERGLRPEVWGVGGAALEAQGARLLARYDDLAVVGLFEALTVVPRALRLLRRLRGEMRRNRPDLFIAVDSPELNLRLARSAAELGVPVVYFIAPQVWAWRPRRVEQLRRWVTELLVLFPFEEAWFRARGVPVTYVGHPLVEQAQARPRRTRGAEMGGGPRTTILLLPGSRAGEVRRHLPIMAGAAIQTAARGAQEAARGAPGAGRASGSPDAGIRWRLRMADALPETLYRPWCDPAGIELSRAPLFELAEEADLAVAASGTASFEAAIVGTPTLVVYRVHPLTWRLARRLVRVPWISMINLAAGREILPEMLQEDVRPETLAQAITALLSDAPRRVRMEAELHELRGSFGPPGAYARAAERAATHLPGEEPEDGV